MENTPNNEKNIGLNFIMNGLLMLSSFIFPLFAFPYVSRVLMAEGTGRVAFVSAVISYFTIFAQLGIPTYGIRACARVRDDARELARVVCELELLSFVMGALSLLVLSLAVLFVPRLHQEKDLFMVMSVSVMLSALGMEWLYRALEQYVYITVRSLIFKLIALAGMLLLIKSGEDYVIYGGLTVFAASASNIFNFINAFRIIDIKNAGKLMPARHLKAVFIFLAQSVAVTVYTNLDSAMLGFMKENAQVGYYNAAVLVKNMLVNLLTSLGVVLLPRASYYIEKKLFGEFDRIVKKSFAFLLFSSLCFLLYFEAYAKDWIYVLSGKGYEGAVLPMQVILPALVLICISNVLGIQILVPKGREICVFYSELAGAGVDLCLNLLLIPEYGAAGAAAGTLGAEAVVLLVQAYFLRDYLGKLLNGKTAASLLKACLIFALAFVVSRPVYLYLPQAMPALILSAALYMLIGGIFVVYEVLT